MWRGVTTTTEHEIRIGTHLVEQVESGFTHLLRSAVLKQRNGVQITHSECRRRYISDDFIHLALIAKMVGGGTSGYHGTGAVSLVAAVVQNNDEVVVLHAVDDTLDIL